jgi:excisionase family DNA binding protein
MTVVSSTPVDQPAPTTALLLDVKQVAALLNCSVRHVWRLADAGKMPPPRRLGHLRRWSRAEIEAWIAADCRAVRFVPSAGGRS